MTLPLVRSSGRSRPEMPDYLPARMINEFVYCPRLFYYEQVQGIFIHNAETLEGSFQHRRVDHEPKRRKLEEGDEEPTIVRSLTLSSEEHRVIAKLDLVEFDGDCAVPIDYKRGHPLRGEEELEAWPADRVQLAVQAIILRSHGYRCQEGIVFYQATRQRVRVRMDETTILEAERAIQEAWQTAQAEQIPPPLMDSPKCPGCSLVTVCMPDETHQLGGEAPTKEDRQLRLFDTGPSGAPTPPPARRLVPARSDLRPLYLNSQKLRVGKSGGVLQVRDGDTLVQEVRLNEICQVNLMGHIQLTTQAVQALCEAEKPICYFSHGGWFYGITTGLGTKNVFLRRQQFQMAEEPRFCLRLARRLVSGKIRNQRTLLMRNHLEPSAISLRQLRRLAQKAEKASSQDALLGIEGAAAGVYFGQFSGMIKQESGADKPSPLSFDFNGRNRRPPRDGINALLSLGYSVLVKDLTIACYAVGFDPMIGFYHQPRHGRPALALDLMEPLRPLIVDSAVLSAVNTRMISESDFVSVGGAVSLTPQGRKAFFRAYELRMDTLVTHPLFDYRVSYRRILEIQARLLAKTLEGEIDQYPVFTTR